MRKLLRVVAIVVAGLVVLAGAGFAVKTLVLDDDEQAAAVSPVTVRVLEAGSYDAAHAFAPYYVVPRKRLRDPLKLSAVARNRYVTQPEAALRRGALPGSPQIVRLELRNGGDEPAVVNGISFDVVSDARALRGWYTATPGCGFESTVKRAVVNLDAARPRARFFAGAKGKPSPKLSLRLAAGATAQIELQASTRRRRVAWTAELSVAGEDAAEQTVAVSDGGKPFRVTARRSSRGYEPLYGASGVASFARDDGFLRDSRDC